MFFGFYDEWKFVEGKYELIIFWWWIFCYIWVEIEMKDVLVFIDQAESCFIVYFFEEWVVFDSDKELLFDIWFVSWCM